MIGVVLPNAIYFHPLVTRPLLWTAVIWVFGIVPFLLTRALCSYLPLVTTNAHTWEWKAPTK